MKCFAQSLLFAVVACRSQAAEFIVDEECARIRRPIHLVSTADLWLYVEGMERIRANGKYQFMVDAHEAFAAVHRGSSFFFYHSYFVWEVETQIRKLGAKFQCFAVPYYDWTIDAGNERSPFALRSVFGGDGDEAQNDCVETSADSPWNNERWPLRELCDESENASEGCCLKRRLFPDALLGSASEVGRAIAMREFDDFRGVMAAQHHQVHALFGGGDASQCGRCAMSTGYSPNDPIFMILHSFLSYTRALWAVCHGYDQIDPADLDAHPEAYTAECSKKYGECGAIELDEAFQFGALTDAQWSLASRMRVTPRKMWDFEPWRVQFDHGTFVQTSRILESALCDANNVERSKWFVLDDELEQGEDCFVDTEIELEGQLQNETMAEEVQEQEQEVAMPAQPACVDCGRNRVYRRVAVVLLVLIAIQAVSLIKTRNDQPPKEDRRGYVSLREDDEPLEVYVAIV